MSIVCIKNIVCSVLLNVQSQPNCAHAQIMFTVIFTFFSSKMNNLMSKTANK